MNVFQSFRHVAPLYVYGYLVQDGDSEHTSKDLHAQCLRFSTRAL